MQFRSEYLKLGSDLPGLAIEFDCRLSAQNRQDALILALAMDQIDDQIDSRPLFHERQEIYREVLDSLRTGRGELTGRPEAYRFTLTEVRRAAERAGQLEPFCATVEELMQVGEQLRATDSPRLYAELSEREADVTVALLYQILHPARPSARFQRFLRQSGVVGNLADKLLDLGEDRREGRSRVRPGAWLYLLPRILRAARDIPFLHPRPLALVSWAWSYFQYGLRYVTGLEPAWRPWSPATGGVAGDCESRAEPSAR